MDGAKFWTGSTTPAGKDMAKSLRSKVKKRLRTVKRGVVKAELRNPTSKLGVRETQKSEKLQEALSGYIKPGTHAHRTQPSHRTTNGSPHLPRCPAQASGRRTPSATTTPTP